MPPWTSENDRRFLTYLVDQTNWQTPTGTTLQYSWGPVSQLSGTVPNIRSCSFRRFCLFRSGPFTAARVFQTRSFEDLLPTSDL